MHLQADRTSISIRGLTTGSGYGLHGEGSCNPGLGIIHERLVVEGLLIGIFLDGCIDLLSGHAFFDLRIVGDGFQGDMGDGLVAEAAANALLGMGQLIVIKESSHETLLGQGDGYARGVAGDPAAAPLLGHIGGGAGAAGGIKDQIAGVGGHEEATCNSYVDV